MKMTRPSFVAAALGLTGVATSRRALAAAGPVPRRRLGRTEQMVSIVGMGGYHIGIASLTDDESVRLMHAGVDRGINFFDNCWDYNGGNSERRMGEALARGGYRDRVVLMTKIDGRTEAAARRQIDESLSRLQTDRIDLVQFHENIRPDDAERIFAPGGALEAVLSAKRAGKVRFVGFTGHKRPAYHVHMMEVADRHGFTFDAVQMPLNVLDAHFDSFAREVIPAARARDMGVLAMKTFGGGGLVRLAGIDPIEMLQYGMHLPTSVVITGIPSPEILDQAIAAASTYIPFTDARVAALLAKTAPLAADGALERYKTTTDYDGTTHNPQWLG